MIYGTVSTGVSAIYTLDQDLIEISVRSLQVTLSALLISSLFALPLAAVLAVKRFKFRRFIIALLNALMGLPPVVVGLIVYILISLRTFWRFGLTLHNSGHGYCSDSHNNAIDYLNCTPVVTRTMVRIS